MRQLCIALVAVSLLLTACGATGRTAAEPVRAPAQAAASERATARPTPAPRATPTEAASPHAGGHHHSAAALKDFPDGVRPVRIRIPAIDVDATVVELGQRSDGSLETPEDFGLAGWWRGGPQPGAPGAAVIAGHVDSRRGPAVFFDLRELAEGDEIVVEDEEGHAETFTVERLAQVPKDEFPTDLVYGYTRQPTLRLITCGGQFDRSVRSYRDNVVAFATGSPPAGGPAPALARSA